MTTPAPLHAETARRWHGLPLAEQLAHVGSEVERAWRAHVAGNTGRREHAVARALELFDLTATDARWRGPRRRELLRAREEFCALLYADHPPSAEPIRRYYLAFARLARTPRPRPL